MLSCILSLFFNIAFIIFFFLTVRRLGMRKSLLFPCTCIVLTGLYIEKIDVCCECAPSSSGEAAVGVV